MKKLKYINACVIGYLAHQKSDFENKGKKYIIAEYNEDIFDILNLVGLTNTIEIYETNEKAIHSLINDDDQIQNNLNKK